MNTNKESLRYSPSSNYPGHLQVSRLCGQSKVVGHETSTTYEVLLLSIDKIHVFLDFSYKASLLNETKTILNPIMDSDETLLYDRTNISLGRQSYLMQWFGCTYTQTPNFKSLKGGINKISVRVCLFKRNLTNLRCSLESSRPNPILESKLRGRKNPRFETEDR